MEDNNDNNDKKIILIEEKKENKKVKTKKSPKMRKKIKEFQEKNENKLILENHENDKDILNKIYIDDEFENKKFYIQSIKQKITSYLQQDKIKNRNIDNNISFDETIEKLIISKLRCYYCKQKILLINPNKLQKNMWTLDRINNDLSHTNENTCISCLSCNLQKRKRNHENFKFTKQLIISKTYFED